LLVGGCWSVVAGRWLLVGGCWSVVAGRWLLVGGCWSVVAGRWLLIDVRRPDDLLMTLLLVQWW
jgi:hypothetical protein